MTGIEDTGHEIYQTHPESIYSVLFLISKSKDELVAMNNSGNWGITKLGGLHGHRPALWRLFFK